MFLIRNPLGTPFPIIRQWGEIIPINDDSPNREETCLWKPEQRDAVIQGLVPHLSPSCGRNGSAPKWEAWTSCHVVVAKDHLSCNVIRLLLGREHGTFQAWFRSILLHSGLPWGLRQRPRSFTGTQQPQKTVSICSRFKVMKSNLWTIVWFVVFLKHGKWCYLLMTMD